MERVLSRTTSRFLTDVDRFMDVVSSSSVSGVGSCEMVALIILMQQEKIYVPST